MLATSALDPSFGTGGIVAGPIGSDAASLGTTAVAVQRDGWIVTAEVHTYDNYPSSTPLLIHRYNANGTTDTTFGTGGTTTIPFANPGYVQTTPQNLVVTSSGQIIVAAEVTLSDATSTRSSVVDVVVRLTSTGALDPTFGSGGVVTLPSSIASVSSVGVESTGRIVVAGVTAGASATTAQLGLLALTTTGTIDTMFGTGGTTTVPLASTVAPNPLPPYFLSPKLLITPTDQLLVAVDSGNTFIKFQPYVVQHTLSRLTANGAIDSTFGSGTGTVNLTNPTNSLALQADGRIIVAGIGLTRLKTDGSVDPSFANGSTPNSASDQTFESVVVGTNDTITALSSDESTYLKIAGQSRYRRLGSGVYRFHADGTLDSSFGRGGKITIDARSNATDGQVGNALALTSTGNLVVAGLDYVDSATSGSLLLQVRPIRLPQVVNDYEGIGFSEQAAFLPQLGLSAYRGIRGSGGDVAARFGPTGDGQAIPAPGDYDGDGKADQALYLPNLGILAYRPSGGGGDAYVRFGPTGGGEAIPTPGDYDGDGRTDVALYLPGPGVFIVRPSNGAAPYQVQFGMPGAGNSIPVPGDYDGSGETELAVYLPTLGALVYRPAKGGADVAISFGPAGVGASIPVPGDYDGDGKTDVALYLPGNSTFVIRPSSGTAPYPVTFGSAGAGASIPVPGDYDGDGRTDIAVFLTGPAVYAIAPSGGDAPYSQQFGVAGAGNTVPVTVVSLSSSVSAMSLRSAASTDPNAGVVVFLDDTTPRKKTTA